MSSEKLHGARRLHPVAMVIGAVKTVRQWVGAAAIPGAAALVGTGLRWWVLVLILLGALLLVVGAAVWGVLSWRATTYDVSGGAFHLRRGVLQKNERTIPLEHVQSVDVVQGVIQRVFGVVEVRVETAGGSVAGANEPDASLSALSRDAAGELRREVEGARREPAEAEKEAGPEVIRRLSAGELLVAGATSGQLGVALSVVAVGSQLFDNFLDNAFFERVFESLAPTSVTGILLLTLTALFIAWLLSVAGTVLAYSGFTLSRDGEFLYIRRGLLERREATIPLARIQAVRLVEGSLRQPFELAMLRVESAGYGENEGVSTTLFPLLPRREARDLLRRAAPEFAILPDLNPLPARARRRYMLRSAAPVLILAAIGFVLSGLSASPIAYLAALALLVLAALYGLLRYRDAGWALVGGSLVLRSRTVARTTSVAPRRRLQSRSVVQSPFQRRAALATLEVRVASGSGGSRFSGQDLELTSARALSCRLGPSL